MDKRYKTRWEIKIRRIEVALMILLPLLFGFGFWLLAAKTRFSAW